ncbi:ABC transporter substrate-binding protein [Caminibacter pacificus]
MKRFLILVLIVSVLFAKKDFLNREVKIPKNIHKIVCIGPGALRLVVYLQAQNRVVGIEEREFKYIFARPYIIAHKELLKLPVIGMGGVYPNINIEKIISLKPDLIIAGYITKKYADYLQKKSAVPVFVVRYGPIGSFDDKKFLKAIKVLGEILNKKERAIEISKYIEKLNSNLQKVTTNKKIYIGGVAFKGLHGLTSTISDFPVFLKVGIKNVVTSKIKTPFFINEEELFRINPDIIFIDESALGLIDFKKYQILKAFREKQVYGLLPYNNYATNIATAYLDSYYVLSVVGNKKIDMEKLSGEVYKFFVGKDVYESMKKFFGGFKKID